jgi:SAM-dependent methyltransferase
MSPWRWAVYKVSYYVGRALIRAARILAYATAGVLTKRELGRASAGRWSDFGIDETYVMSGLFTWEENFYFRFLKPDDHVLIVGAGSGRDLIGLRKAGVNADGLEPSETAVGLARTMCAKAGVQADFHTGWIETATIPEKYDVFIFSWYCYSYICDRATRVGALRGASKHLAPGGRIILSYTVTEPVTRFLPRAVAERVGRVTGTDWSPLPTDIIMFEHGGLHFEHQFLPGEIESEVLEAGLRIKAHQVGDDGLIMLMADE